MRVNVYIVHAFCRDNMGGNPAGVVLDADGLSTVDMQKVASMAGFPETAFISRSLAGDVSLRYFTPENEVDLCGHATVASFHLLVREGRISPGKHTFECRAGLLKARTSETGEIFLEQPLPEMGETLPAEEAAASLGISVGDLHESLPVQIVSAGLPDIMVPIRSRDVLESIQPDFARVAEISRKYHAIGYHLYALNEKSGPAAFCRNLAPAAGIPEESATGTASGALCAYLYHHQRIAAGPHFFHQGESMGLPSIIKANLTAADSGKIERLEIGGAAKLKEKMLIHI
ncbi:PhzF family phenazine biosynthesis protein [Bacillus infantis]|uniref:PhzF family phenazine biosynthesis protein n=1 Tax=Bacillus infantis TaxID=324767 RepID=UPI001CD7919D|nr:PhzF family phenazine biosynthesis protein [Bacillus infantis]MCA1038607.1 PhzF family phenazine biosynthesis protein [Bacillus infantis]